jgi:hypothetical protein
MADPRYLAARFLLEKGEIKSFADIFTYVPYTVVAGDLRTNNNRMKRMIADPGQFHYEEIIQLSELLDYDCKKLMLLAGLDVDKLMKGK